MEEIKNHYVKRTQKDYTESLKIRIVEEVESGKLTKAAAKRQYGIQGEATIRNWIEKYGNLDKSYKIRSYMEKSPEQELMELRQELKLLKKKNQRLEKELENQDKKVLFFDMMIDIAEEEFNIPIRKKSLYRQSKSSKKKQE